MSRALDLAAIGSYSRHESPAIEAQPATKFAIGAVGAEVVYGLDDLPVRPSLGFGPGLMLRREEEIDSEVVLRLSLGLAWDAALPLVVGGGFTYLYFPDQFPRSAYMALGLRVGLRFD